MRISPFNLKRTILGSAAVLLSLNLTAASSVTEVQNIDTKQQLSESTERSLETQNLPEITSTNDLKWFKSRFPTNYSKKKDSSVFNTCDSASILNSFTGSNSLTNPSQSKYEQVILNVRLNADNVPVNSDEITLLEGHVTMTTNASVLTADKLISDNLKETIEATGNISVESNDSLLNADKFEGDQLSGTSKLTNVDFLFFETKGNGKADSIFIDENKTVILQDLTYSTCPTDNASWRFSASELMLDKDTGWGEAWDMWLKVKGVPIFYFPYLNFPIGEQRKTGMLPPSISTGGKNGFDVSVPIYWNIAEDMDATIGLRSIQNRGNQLSTEFRFLTQNSTNEIAFEWLKNDRLVNELLFDDPSLSEGNYGLLEDRWAFSIQNHTQINEHWSTFLDVNKVSDRDYFRDLDVGLASKKSSYSQSQLQSQGNITYQNDIWTISLYAQSTQSLVGDEPYRVIPSLISNANYYQKETGLYWQFESDFSYFSHTDSTQVKGSRFNVKQSVSYPIRNSYAWLTPKASYQVSHYDYSQLNASSLENPLFSGLQANLLSIEKSQLDRKLPIFSLDTGLFFDRSMTWQQQEITHSLEPRLLYVRIPYRAQDSINIFDSRLPDFSFSQLWQENRFSGNDRIGDTDHVSFSVTNRFVTNKKGEQLLSLSIGQKHYFEDTRVFLESDSEINQESSSPWLVEMTYKLNAKIEVSGFIEWDDHSKTNSTNLARSQINYEPIEDHIVNLSHRLRNKNGLSNEELDLSFAWPINDEWRLVGRWYNDLKKGRTSESLFGVEYESCCFAARIVARRYLDVRLDVNGEPIFINPITGVNEEYNSGIQLQFEFKGLGSAGNDISRLLTKSIRGYRTRF